MGVTLPTTEELKKIQQERWKSFDENDREHIKQLYVSTEESLRSICKTYNLYHPTVKVFASEKHWKQERDEFKAKIVTDTQVSHIITADIKHVARRIRQLVIGFYYDKIANSIRNGTLNVAMIVEYKDAMVACPLEVDTNSVANQHYHEGSNTTIMVGGGPGQAGGGELDGPPGVDIGEEDIKELLGNFSSMLVAAERERLHPELEVTALINPQTEQEAVQNQSQAPQLEAPQTEDRIDPETLQVIPAPQPNLPTRKPPMGQAR